MAENVFEAVKLSVRTREAVSYTHLGTFSAICAYSSALVGMVFCPPFGFGVKTLGGDTNLAADVANQAITDMADNANKMGTDLGTIQNAYQITELREDTVPVSYTHLVPSPSGVYQSGSHTAPSVAKLPVSVRKPPDTSPL